MNVLYSDIEQEIVNKLQPLVTAGIDVVPLPQVEAEFQRPFQHGRVTVVYKGSTFDNHLSTHHVVQDERLQFEIVVVCRRLRGDTGVHGIVEVIKRTLLGFAPTDCSKMRVIKNSYQEYQKEAALWGYSIIFETVYRLVEDAEYDTEQAITEITVDYSTGDSYDITEPPSPLPYVRLSNTNATWIQDAPNGLPFQVPNSPVQVTDESGNPLGTGSVPSVTGGTVSVTLPPCPPIEVDAVVLNTDGIEVASKTVTPTDNEIEAPDGIVHIKKENDGTIANVPTPSGATTEYVVQNNDITVNGGNDFEIHATESLDVRLRDESNNVVNPISVTHAGNHATVVVPTNKIDVIINGTIVADDAVSDVALTLVDQNGGQLPFTQTGTEIKVIPLWASFTTASTTTANWIIWTKDGGQYRVDWGDGTITTHNSGSTASKTYSTPYAGVVKIGAVNGGISNIDGIRSTSGAWNFNISIIKDQLPSMTFEVFFDGNSMALTGNIANLPTNLTNTVFFQGTLMTLTGNIANLPSGLTEEVYFNGNSMTLTGDIATLPSGLTDELYFNGNLMTLTGNIANLPSGLTNRLHLQGNLMTLTGDISTVPIGLSSRLFLIGSSMALTGNIANSAPNATVINIQAPSISTNINYTSGRVWKNVTQLLLRLKTGTLTSNEVDNIFIDLNNSPLVTGAGTIDLRGSNAAPTSASLAARNSLVSKGKTILTN